MRAFGIKVIVGTIKIDGQEENGVESILLPIGLQRDEQHLFGQAVRGVGFFGVTVPELFFPERNRCKFRIGANGSNSHEFLHPRLPGLVKQGNTHHEVIIKKFRRMDAISPNAPHARREMYHQIRI